jgi:hypothetical protein
LVGISSKPSENYGNFSEDYSTNSEKYSIFSEIYSNFSEINDYLRNFSEELRNGTPLPASTAASQGKVTGQISQLEFRPV